MKTILTTLLLMLATACPATTNVIELTWLSPPGYQSTLYCATNVNGSWTSFGRVQPPVYVNPTNPMTFFYVSVAPTNQCYHFTGSGDPHIDALADASYMDTNNGNWWLNTTGGTNGWVWEIAGQ